MKPAHSLARLNGRILNAYSRRTAAALRAALPLRLALPHLEPVLALNVDKEVQKDRLVILRAPSRVYDSTRADNCSCFGKQSLRRRTCAHSRVGLL